MSEFAGEKSVKVVARSPGLYPILIVETSSGDFLTTYSETNYDLEKSKPVKPDWVHDNAIGRHSFIAVEPPEVVDIDNLADFAATP